MFLEKIYFNIFGVKFNGDNAVYDRYLWLKKNLVVLSADSDFLDVGCGNGWSLPLAAKMGFKNVIGLSWNKFEIEKIKQRFGKVKNIDAKILDVRNLDEYSPVTKFDVIINFENLEHILNGEKLIKDISNLLNDGGLLYLTTPNILYKKVFGDGFIKKYPIEDGGHVVRGYSKERLESIFLKHGLKIILANYISGRFSRILMTIERILPFKMLKIFYIPITLLCNFMDSLFYKDDKNNMTIAVVAEKIKL
jgi:2-polyprenyl-3-methyl-5-hydroxy-6-metoxy-1,4-benzoquinol methylase